MVDWREPLGDLRFHIDEFKKSGKNLIEVDRLESLLKSIRDDYQIADKYEILDKINNPENKDVKFYNNYKKMTNDYVEMHSRTFKEAATYVSILIGSGFVTFFGVWSIVKDYIDTISLTLSLLLICTSASFFVLFEVFRTIFISFESSYKSNCILKSFTKTTMKEHNDSLLDVAKYDDLIQLWFARIWGVTTVISLFSGLFGIGLLMKTLISYLLNKVS